MNLYIPIFWPTIFRKTNMHKKGLNRFFYQVRVKIPTGNHPMQRCNAVFATEKVVDGKPGLYDQPPTIGYFHVEPEETEGRSNLAAEPGSDWDEHFQRTDQMRSIDQQTVSLLNRLLDEAEFAGFKVF